MKPEANLVIPVQFHALPSKGLMIKRPFSEEELSSVKEEYGLLSLSETHLTLKLTPVSKAVLLEGHIKAEVSQPCGLTGEPVKQLIDEAFKIRFLKKLPETEEEVIEAGDEDIEPLPSQEADIGPIVEQYFVLALDPYPRSNVEFEDHIEDQAVENSTFAALAALKSKKSDKT